ncbi:30S ribosomal protein S8 [Candidatus Woesebacteria bacterium RIFOXYA1_FULL_43_9]|uniref:Small ribosomal subunit protein uS8 n=1 Tax=Candidatus Woesebacteria bacterium RIFOXYA1_FULL_43_9 TaxID=1802534 RepID=A0A1F8CLU0_9BACT|nr:MAG: 30S ribosomal protein S8 [Candidatus Woesebacteria bacterium RIFOXYA1_FULL_43_9]
MNYPLGDALIRMKNAKIAGNDEFVVPYTKLIFSVFKSIMKLGYLTDLKKDGAIISAKLTRKNKSYFLDGLKVISRPGFRVYKDNLELRALRGPFDYVISTNKGVLTQKETYKANLGGELLVELS